MIGDGITKVAQPRLTGSATVGTTILLENASGQTLGAASVGSTGSYTVTPTSALSDGTYLLHVQAVDVAGNTSAASPAFSLTIDTTPPAAPSAPSLLPADDSGTLGDGITNVKQPHLIGSAEANATLNLLNASGTLIGTAIVSSGGSYSVIPTNPLADGTYILQAQAIDAADNASPLSPAITLTIDTTPPLAPSTPTLLPADDTGTLGDGITTVKQPHLIGTAEANATLKLVDTTGDVLGSTVVSATGAYSVVPTNPLATGDYVLHVTATDAAGNVSPASGSFTLTIQALTGPIPPSAPSLLASDDSGTKGDGITNVNLPHLIGTGTPGTSVELLTQSGTMLGLGSVAADGSWSIVPTTIFADGTYVLDAETIDSSAHASAPSPIFTLTIDTKAPSVPTTPSLLASDDSGTVGDGITNVNRPHLIGSADAGTTIQLLTSLGTVLGSAQANANGTYSVQPTLTLADGTYLVQVESIDVAGNMSALSGTFSLTIKATPLATPAPPTLSPLDDTGVTPNRTANRSPRLVGTAPVGVFVELLSSTGVVLATTIAAPGTGSYVLTPSTSFNPSVVGFSVRIRDVAGNISATSPSTNVTIADTPVGDFDGGGKSDQGTFQPSTAQWVIPYSSGTGTLTKTYGATNLFDIPVPGDYDGIGKNELAVYRPSTAQWIISGPNGTRTITFGAVNSDIPVAGDYDNTGHTEIAVFRPSTAQWFVLGPNGGHLLTTFGATNLFDIPVPGDYDGTGHTEPAVFRPSTAQWFVLGPSGSHLLAAFGATNLFDIPVAGDYDGTGHTEPAVYRPSTGQWFVLGPTGGHQIAGIGTTGLSLIPLEAPVYSLLKLGVVSTIHTASIRAGSLVSLSGNTTGSMNSTRQSQTVSPSAVPTSGTAFDLAIPSVLQEMKTSRTPSRLPQRWIED
jgi:hypothetical protein